jgi:hypothetical protein
MSALVSFIEEGTVLATYEGDVPRVGDYVFLSNHDVKRVTKVDWIIQSHGLRKVPPAELKAVRVYLLTL